MKTFQKTVANHPKSNHSEVANVSTWGKSLQAANSPCHLQVEKQPGF